ncbi:SusE domain-containing protein [Flectobacillus roseus]|uniref:SusE domain-containing protein n=1 Tax=Flectobacillus roseus TaxID=502259 RepID=UPI0024B8007F|nr:SusE domain-containing protein [Flectobacillus roseus]MDI9871768.1 SusE domain-containing protein [Flectobacillus roseus]
MKKIIQYLCLSLFLQSLVACENDEVKTYMSAQTQAPKLSSTQTNYVLSANTANDSTVSLTWARSDYGFSAAAKYTLQIAKAGTNFAAPKEVSLGNATSFKYTTADFNQLAILQGLKPSAVGQLEVRVKSSVSESVADLYSNTLTVSVTPYIVVINYPSLWVAGDFQGWNPATAPKISSRNSNGIYEGYVWISGGTRQFKLTSQPDWNGIAYGWASSTTTGTDVSGTINTSGGNLFVPADGYFLIKANTNTNTWSATKTTWSIIGDAPEGSNWSNDIPMQFDATKNVWKVTTKLNVGSLKFRANSGWTINLGDTGADLSLEYDGTDIKIPSNLTGTRTITLDLKAGNYTYTIE